MRIHGLCRIRCKDIRFLNAGVILIESDTTQDFFLYPVLDANLDVLECKVSEDVSCKFLQRSHTEYIPHPRVYSC